MSSKLSTTEYYLGLDCGTESVGFAVTDTDYNVLKFNGKSMWGSHLFKEASTAAGRRVSRCARRRRKREVQRIKLLQQIFAEEIYKRDPEFFIRLNDSKYIREDKTLKNKTILFNEPHFKDNDFFKKYPTIYHLRADLIENGTDDIRFLYLAIHHILKHRGHFLFPGQDLDSVTKIEPLLDELGNCFNTLYENELSIKSELFEKAIREKNNKNKQDSLSECLFLTDDKLKKNIIKILVGYKVKLKEIFSDSDYDDLPAIEFKKATFETEDLPILEGSLEDVKYRFVCVLKAIHDWALLADIMNNEPYISKAKIKLYKKNKEDLKKLKGLFRKYLPEKYEDFFHSADKNTFSAYIGKNHDHHKNNKLEKENRIKIEDFYKTIKKMLENFGDDPDVQYVLKEIENDSFMHLLSSYANSVIPFQVNKMELDAILSKAESSFPFLRVKDNDGFSPIDKIKSLLTFRIPYYVGPIGTNNNSENTYLWVVKKEKGRVFPWNFEQKIDLENSAEKFITRMTNKCTYCKTEDVLPKNSIAYSKFLVLNELNNVRVKGQRLPVFVKQQFFEEYYKKKKTVRKKDLIEFLVKEGYYSLHDLKKDDISGIDNNFKASFSTFIDYLDYSKKISEREFDEIVKWITLFPNDADKILKNRIENIFGDKLSNDEIKKLLTLSYTGWGSLSYKFLYGLQSIERQSGKNMSIVEMMYETENNLMEVLGQNDDFIKQIEKTEIDKLNYGFVKELYASPSVKKQIWQTLRIVREIEHIMKHPPKKVFIETTRSNKNQKGDAGRKISRKNDLISKLKEAKKTNSDFSIEFDRLLNELENKSESDVSIQDKLYLYFSQCGKCMYSGERIELSDLYNVNVYDIDHIYPQSKIKDDSLINNRVLVKKKENGKKTDIYPIEDSIRNKMKTFWEMLVNNHFISKEKYDRLTRTDPLTNEELKSFIKRQLVETNQNTKLTKDILRAYFGNQTKVVFSKAENVVDFRNYHNSDKNNENKFVKCRTMNSLHHAKDAYLNIVVGNVYDSKYTEDFFKFKMGESGYGNVSEPFKYDVPKAWIRGREGTIKTVEKYMKKNDIILSRQPYMGTGQLYDLQLLPKGKAAFPAKTSDYQIVREIEAGNSEETVYKDYVKKYGGYNSLTVAYFSVVRYKKKNKDFLRFIPITKIDSKKINNVEKLKEYCCNSIGIQNVEVVIEKLSLGSLLDINGFKYIITGKQSGGKVITLSNCISLVLSNENQITLKHIERFNNDLKTNKDLDVNRKIITEENVLCLFDELINKTREGIYEKRISNQNKFLQSPATRDAFINLSLKERCLVILELLKYFGKDNGQADFSLIGGKKQTGTMTKGVGIDLGKDKISFLFQSVTGLFEKKLEV